MLKHAQAEERNQPTIKLSRTTLMLRRLQASLRGRAGKAPSYLDMEAWTGVPEGTVKDWFSNKGRPTADFIINLMERVPEKARHESLDSACRSLPTLEHPWLKCDQTVRSHFNSIVGRKNGIAFIQGVTDEARTFLVSALGNAYLTSTEPPCRVTGFDVHEPDWFVPVPGVKYLRNLFGPDLLRAAVRQMWPQLGSGRMQLILLNGIWSVLPELQTEILSLAKLYPVLVADATIPDPSWLRRHRVTPAHLVSISKDPANGNGIVVAIQSL